MFLFNFRPNSDEIIIQKMSTVMNPEINEMIDKKIVIKM